MSQAEFSLQERDRQRLIKDRLVRFIVSCGGVGVLIALVLIFIYLAMVVLPLFSDAKLTPNQVNAKIESSHPVAIKIDDYGKQALIFERQGAVRFLLLQQGSAPTIFFQSVLQQASLFVKSSTGSDWYGYGDDNGNVVLLQPEFHSTSEAPSLKPEVKIVPLPHDYLKQQGKKQRAKLKNFTFDVGRNQITLVRQSSNNKLTINWYNRVNQAPEGEFTFALPVANVQQMLLTPDGKTLYLRSGDQLIVAVRSQNQFVVREIVDLSQGNSTRKVTHIDLLSGAYSLLVSYSDRVVSQWFDVLRDKQRHLTHIRDFQQRQNVSFLLPDSYRKGFYSFYQNGQVQSFYTTSEKVALFSHAYTKAPQLAALSDNERHLLTLTGHKLSVARLDNPYPEISVASLWHKVWYEGYAKPDYVWQSTAASDQVEPKYSVVPIIFGTLKAGLFAMLFSVPVAVFGAIYTAYFMSARMRSVVKPSIELMEALPTVIIGFLAGLWLAPIIENHLITVVLVIIAIPLAALLVGALWGALPFSLRHRFPNGWHALILMPAIVLMVVVMVWFAPEIEHWLFAGDIRYYLTEHGIGFDQRNALVVGIAMGFAVIPTIFTIAEDAIFSVPKHLSDGSLALGATPWQTLTRVVLVTASPGIFSAIMMGFGRAIGETMIVLMATGNTPLMDWNILEGMRTLSATIAVELPESEVGSSHFRLLFLVALLLLIFTFAVNSLAEWVRQRLRDNYRAL